MNPFGNTAGGVQGYNDMVVYGIVVGILLAVLLVGRFVLRRLVNRRVRGINVEKLGFTDIDAMKNTGLMSEEEMKLVRRRYAERQLQEMHEEEAAEKGIPAEQLLQLYESDPSLAKPHIGSMNDLVRRSLGEWLEKKARKEGVAPPSSLAQSESVAKTEDIEMARADEPAEEPAGELGGEPGAPSMGAADATGRATGRATSGQGSAAGASGSDDLDPRRMYAKGLISLDEFKMLVQKKDRKAGGTQRPTTGQQPGKPAAQPARPAAQQAAQPAATQQPSTGPASPPPQARPKTAQASSSGKTIDLELLRSKGLLSDEEYAQLLAKMQSAKDG